MRETELQIPTPDGKVIYVVQSGNPEGPGVIIGHGYGGHAQVYTFKRFAQLTEPEFCTYRVNFYDGRKGGRRALDCTFQTHADDLKTVADFLAPRHSKLFMVGHSFGGPSVMLANSPRISAASLWDPTYNVARTLTDFSAAYEDRGDHYLIHWGESYAMGKDMHAMGHQLSKAACDELSVRSLFPVQVILAGSGYYIDKGDSYDTACAKPNRRDVVPEADHCFFNHDTADMLTAYTTQWFNQWL